MPVGVAQCEDHAADRDEPERQADAERGARDEEDDDREVTDRHGRVGHQHRPHGDLNDADVVPCPSRDLADDGGRVHQPTEETRDGDAEAPVPLHHGVVDEPDPADGDDEQPDEFRIDGVPRAVRSGREERVDDERDDRELGGASHLFTRQLVGEAVKLAPEHEQKRRRDGDDHADEDVARDDEDPDDVRDEQRGRGRQGEPAGGVCLRVLGLRHESPDAEEARLHENQHPAQSEDDRLVDDHRRRADEARQGERPDPGGLVRPLPFEAEQHPQCRRDEQVEHDRALREASGTVDHGSEKRWLELSLRDHRSGRSGHAVGFDGLVGRSEDSRR